MTKEQFIEDISVVGWTAKGEHPNQFVIDNKGNNTGIRLLKDRFEYEQGGLKIIAYYHKTKFELIDSRLYLQSINDDSTTGFFLSFKKVR